MGGVAYYVYMKFTKSKDVETELYEETIFVEQSSGFISKSNEVKDLEARNIAKSVKTHRGLEGLQNKIDALGDKMDDYHYNDKELMYEKAEEKQSIMGMALEYAQTNPYRYYYVEDLTVDTPLSVLKILGKTISVQKYNELDEKDRNKYYVVTLEEAENINDAEDIAKDDSLIEDEYLKDIIDYRKIIESNETDEEKEKKFNKLVIKSDYLMDELYLDETDNISLYEQYKHIQITNEKINKLYPLPYANFFINNGYETIEVIASMTNNEILGMDGVGKKKLSEIRNYLDTCKNNLS